MNANVASTTAPTTNNTTVCIGFWTRGRRSTSVFRHDLKTARTYARKKAREGYVIGSVYVWFDSDGTKCANVHLIPRAHYSIITPGYQECEVINHRDGSKFAIMAYEERDCVGDVFIYRECADIPAPAPEPVQYGVRTIVNGVIEDWTRYDTELDARESAQNIVDADPTGDTHATIIPIMPDGALGGVLDVIRYEPPTESAPINAVEECANICPTAQDAVNIASILDTPIRIITPTYAIEVNWTVCRVEIRRNSPYRRGFIELEDVSFDMDKDGLRISYYEKGINHFDDWFIAWGDIQTITALTSKLDIFRSVKGAN